LQMVSVSWLLLPGTLLGEDDTSSDWRINAEELGRYYEGKGKAPPWPAAVDLLFDENAEKASKAGRYLAELAAQVLADETSGASRWHATPYWGSEGENEARKLREFMILSIAPEAKKEGFIHPVAAVPVLEWFIRKEPVVDHRMRSMEVLVKLEGKEADALVQSLAADDTLIHGLSASAIQRATVRGLDLPEAGLLTALADHHADRSGAAELHWKKQFGTDAPLRFDPVKAVESPKVRKILDEFGSLLMDPMPAEAPWILVERKWKPGADGKAESEPMSSRGWLLQHQGKQLRILDLHGRAHDFTLGENPGHGWRGISTVSFREQSMKELVEEIEALRKKGDPDFALSPQGGFSGQFQGSSAGVPEMLLALQLQRSEKSDLCARILLPALASHSEDNTFFEIAKHRLATIYGYRMFVEFIGNRDYDAALAVAAKIERDFKGTRFHQTALRLIAELPGRRDDFRDLSLPTREKWEAWQATHSREEQIEFLCRRLRLMNCYQYGQPGDVDMFDIQYAEPCGLSLEASGGLFLGKTKVINPLEELLGNPEPISDEYDENGDDVTLPPIPGMKLGVRDVPVIAPFLREDHLILSVGYWREFHPSRTMTGTRELLAWVLRIAAKRELVDDREWGKLDEAEIAKRIDVMVAWAKERAGKSDAELLLEALSDLAEGGKSWHEAGDIALELAELGDQRAFPLVARWLKHPECDEYDVRRILPVLEQLDVARAKDHALAYLDHENLALRLKAAMILLKSGDVERALPLIGKAFSEANYSNMSDDTMDAYCATVMEVNSPQAWEAIEMLFDDNGIATLDDFDSVACCRALESHGSPAGLKHYRALLDNRETGIPNMVSWSRPIAYKFGDKLLDGYAPQDKTARKILADTQEDSEARLAATRIWLDGRLAKVNAGGN
jgi:hypothetical protein